MNIKRELLKYLNLINLDIDLLLPNPDIIPCINNINNIKQYGIYVANKNEILSLEKENIHHFCTVRENGRIKRLGKSLKTSLVEINNNLEQGEEPYSIIVFEDKTKKIYEYYELNT